MLRSVLVVAALAAFAPYAHANTLNVVTTTEDLAEWDYGDYEGITTPEIRESVPGWTVWSHPSPRGETAGQVSERLDRVVALQSHLLDIAAELVCPGGALVYAVCSILSREGAGQIRGFISRRSSWIVQETPIAAGRLVGGGRLLTPGHDGTDGFFVARLRSPC